MVEIGDNVIIDDFCYISTSLSISSNVHISSGCKIIGGKSSSVIFGEFSTLSPNVVLAAGSDDYLSGIATPMVSPEFKANSEIGTIDIGRHCIIGSNSTILPHCTLEDGVAVGANSLVNDRLEEWTLNVGVPAKKIKTRNKHEILELERKLTTKSYE